MSRASIGQAALVLLTLGAADPTAALDMLRVRTTSAVAPCLAPVVRAYEAGGPARVALETGELRALEGPIDLLVGSAIELTHAIESGEGLDATQVAVARIPWVVVVAPEAGVKIERLADLGRAGLEVSVLGGPAGYEARRALAEVRAGHVRESQDLSELKHAPLSLVPLSLAGAGEQVKVDVAPLAAYAAVATRSLQRATAERFLAFLSSEAGQQAFAACGTTRR